MMKYFHFQAQANRRSLKKNSSTFLQAGLRAKNLGSRDLKQILLGFSIVEFWVALRYAIVRWKRSEEGQRKELV